MSIKDLIVINQMAQNVITETEGYDWFSRLSVQSQQDLLRQINIIILEAHPTTKIVQQAIEQSGLKPTYTPCVLLSKGEIREQLAKIANLPSREYGKAFKLLTCLFRLADHARRTAFCQSGCSHWWHRPLDKPEVVQHILDVYDSK